MYQGRLYVQNIDDLRERFFVEAHDSRYPFIQVLQKSIMTYKISIRGMK